MAYKNWKREYHRNRLAKKYRYYHFHVFDSNLYGLHREYAEYVNGCGWFPIYTKYGKSRSRRDYSYVHMHLQNPEIVSRDLCFSDIDFWEAQEIGRRDEILYAKKWTDKGSLIGYGKSKKWLRTKYNRQRRRNGKKYSYHAIRDNLDWADDRITHEKRPPYWWDIF